MPDINQLLEMLKSNNPNKRYDACEQLRVASSIPEEALSALRMVTQDSDPDVADAARRALAMHTSSSPNSSNPGMGDPAIQAEHPSDASQPPFETRKFLLTFPPVQAFVIYMVSLILGLIKPDLAGIGFIILIAFSILSPIANLFAPFWWLNTAAFLLSWYGLVSVLASTYEKLSGSSLGAGGMILIPSMMAILFALPLTALIKLIMYISNKRSAPRN